MQPLATAVLANKLSPSAGRRHWYTSEVGEWGTGPFQNDTAADVKAVIMKLLGDGLTGQELESAIINICTDEFEEETEAATLAMALTLHKFGHLSNEIAVKAINMIERELASTPVQSRENHLLKARSTLVTPQKKPRRPKRQVPYIAPFSPGDLFAVTTPSGRKAVIYVTGRSATSRIGDVSNTVRILGEYDSSFSAHSEPDVPHLGGNEFENPQRYFYLLLTSPPSGVEPLGQFLPVPDHRPESLKELMDELAAKGLVRLPGPDDGRPTGGVVADWQRFLLAVEEVVG